MRATSMPTSVRALVAAVCAGGLAACASLGGGPAVPAAAESIGADAYVEALGPGLWRHVSHRYYPAAGYFPSNGLVVAIPGGALIVDTAWGEAPTAALLDWVERTVGPPRALIVTHAHDDRMGGIEEVHRRGVPSWGLSDSSAWGERQGWPPLTHIYEGRLALDRFGIEGEAFFPGAGHTPDNIVVWLAGSRTLFGSCMVRAQASGIGNLGDAVPEAWPRSAAALVERYRDARRVVPGHGVPGGVELLTHTAQLAGQL